MNVLIDINFMKIFVASKNVSTFAHAKPLDV